MPYPGAVADEPSTPSDEEFSVRLSWPKPGEPTPPTTPARPDAPAGTRPPALPERPVPAPPAPLPAKPTAEGPSLLREAKSPDPLPGTEGVPPGKAFVEAFDRLADRLLDRLRTLRQDIDADLGAVRLEVASLRQSVDDLSDRTQLRQVQTTVDEVRTELAALRRAVLEWPELEQVSNDIAAVRGDLAFVFESAGDGPPGGPPSALLVELRSAIGMLSDEITRFGKELPQIGTVSAVLEEVASVRSELTQVRRRMQLRSGPLDDEQLEQVVAAVAERVVEELTGSDGKRRRR
jgi:hypothetical protein